MEVKIMELKEKITLDMLTKDSVGTQTTVFDL